MVVSFRGSSRGLVREGAFVWGRRRDPVGFLVETWDAGVVPFRALAGAKLLDRHPLPL